LTSENKWNLIGKNLIACKRADSPAGHFTAGGMLAQFDEASGEHIDRALEAAEGAFHVYRQVAAERRAEFLDCIAGEIEKLGNDLLTVANVETSLAIATRLAGERARTTGQLRMFANLIREGSWVDARIDCGNPDRKPLPKPDIRRMLIPIGPVAVFAASNFPLAFSVAGGDTASVLAGGCPVIVKAHPAHPATSELVARAVIEAAKTTGMPAGVFSLIYSTRNEIAMSLVQHPLTKAVGFTGSLRAGRALFDAAAGRQDPIAVFAEMGSVNPVFVLPGALRERADAIAEGMKNSVTLGVGQFCTCPGLAVGIGDERFDRFVSRMEKLIRDADPAPMLYPGIFQSFEAGVQRLSAVQGVHPIRSSITSGVEKFEARPLNV
jgi:2,5-dioxopentanoate dehydrogenase